MSPVYIEMLEFFFYDQIFILVFCLCVEGTENGVIVSSLSCLGRVSLNQPAFETEKDVLGVVCMCVCACVRRVDYWIVTF